MKLLAAFTALALVVAPLTAAEWPSAIVQYEEVALRTPGRTTAFWEVWRYATATDRIDELTARWEARASGAEGLPYRLLLGLLAEFRARPQEALVHYTQATDAAPQSVLAWQLRGRCELQQKQPGAILSLEKAVEGEFATGASGSAVEPLVRAYQTAGREPEAQALLDRAIQAVREPGLWLSFTRQRTELAQAQGKLGELLASLEANPWGLVGGSTIVQIYQTIGDYQQEEIEIAKARTSRPDDEVLREQALTLYRSAAMPSDTARLRREQAREKNSPAAWRALFEILVANRSLEEARSLLENQGAALRPFPLAWRSSVPKLWELGLAKPVADLLEKDAGTTGWEETLLRAELLIGEKEYSAAGKALWSLFEARHEARPISREALAAAGRTATYYGGAAVPGAYFMDRTYRLASLRNYGTIPFNLDTERDTDYRVYRVETLQDARDVAILYLAIMAADAGQAPEYLARLEIVAAGWSPEERLLAFSIAENPPAMMREILAVAAAPHSKDTDSFCRSVVRQLARLRQGPEWTAQVEAVQKQFPTAESTGEKPASQSGIEERLRAVCNAYNLGRTDEALGIFAEAMTLLRSGASADPTTCGMSLAVHLRPFSGEPQKLIAGALMAVKAASPRSRVTKLVRADDGLKALFGTQQPGNSYSTYNSGPGSPISPGMLPEEQRGRLVYPPETLFTWEQSGVLWTVFGETRSPSIWAAFKEKLDAEIAAAPVEEARFLRAAAAYFAWWNNESTDAIERMQQLLADTGDANIRVGLASMLRYQESPAAAERLLAEMPRPYPAYERTIDHWRLRLAAEAQNAQLAATLARSLTTASDSTLRWRDVLPVLESKGCKEAADLVRGRLVANSMTAELDSEQSSALSALAKAGARTEAVELAKRVLAAPAVPRRTQTSRNGARREALEVLQRFGERDAYLAPIRKAAESADAPLEIRLRVAEALSGPESTAAWEKVVAADPGNLFAAWEVFNSTAPNSAERRRAMERLLALQPDAVLDRQSDLLFYSYENARELPRLAEAIAAAPFRPVNTWRRPQPGRWSDLGQRFANARLQESAALVLRKANTLQTSASPSLQRLLIGQLLLLKKNQEAGQAIVDYFDPPDRPSAALFAFLGNSNASSPGGAFDPELLKLAVTAGTLPELSARLEKIPIDKSAGGLARAFLLVMKREATVLPEVAKLASTIRPENGEESWVLPLAAELAVWPEGKPGAVQLLVAYGPAVDRMNSTQAAPRFEMARLATLLGDREQALRFLRSGLESAMAYPNMTENRKVFRPLLELVLEIGGPELSAKCREFFGRLITEHVERNNYFEFDDAVFFADRLVGSERAGEAQPILDALRGYQRKRPDSNLALRLRCLEMKAGLRRGDWTKAMAIVWLDPKRSTLETAALAWDLGLIGRQNSDSASPAVRGLSEPAFEGQLTVELFFGEDEGSMQLLARLPGVGSRGLWQGPLPSPSGSVRAVFYRGEKMLFGLATEVRNLPNLFRPGESGGATEPDPQWQEHLGGPAVEGSFSSFRAVDPGADWGNVFIPLSRVKVQPGSDYVLSGWVRAAGRREARLTWRCLDRDGNPLTNGQLASSMSGGEFWTQGSKRLYWPRDGVSGDRFPTGTAFLEPVFEGVNGDFSGLSIVEVPVVKSSPNL